jgi:ATP-dependent DNA ligase
MILYKISGVGNLLMWSITQEKNLLYIQYSGQLQTIECASEPEAQTEMKRRVNHRINRLGWSTDPNQAKAIRAMLINTTPPPDYPQEVMVSIKYDGVRGMLSDRLISRRGSLISSVPYSPSEIILDGEIYHEDYDFETISGLCRQQLMTPKSKKLILHVFDQYLEGVPFHERYNNLPEHPFTCRIPHFLIKCSEVDDFYQKAIEEGHEGIIVRDPQGQYESDVRTKFAWKMKPVDKEWFTVVDVVDKPLSKGKAIFVFSEPAFEATLNYPTRTQQFYFKNPDKIIGRQVEVEYRGKSKFGIPKAAKVVNIPLYSQKET